jgi:hypothetical protein
MSKAFGSTFSKIEIVKTRSIEIENIIRVPKNKLYTGI